MKNQIEKYFDRLWPINRSLTGDGNRETLKILSEIVKSLEIQEIPSGTKCFDWTVPPEWKIKEAWIRNSRGEKIIDFAENNLHVIGYSTPINKKINLEELKSITKTLPEQPGLIPYVTSYYKERYGFCMSHNQLESLKEDTYHIFIDSQLDYDGSMTIGDAVLKGESKKEILLSTYICHPSMASNELSGPLVTSFLYNELLKIKNRKYTYRFLFLPETIGSICYLSMYGDNLKQKLIAGYVVTCIGDNGNFTYKKSRMGNSLADRASELVLKQSEKNYNIIDFFPMGSDERQYCSPGFNLPVGSLMRTMYGIYPEYHTSGDNKDFINFEALENSIKKYLDIFKVIEYNFKYINKMPYCEPQLGKRGLYPTMGGKGLKKIIEGTMWLLNQSDGKNDLIDIANKSNVNYNILIDNIDKLLKSGILIKGNSNF
ncbi:MAG: DUF4910 domain-containing protein [Chlorobi bacterium]|nr:DUF4910 domain-containing protein [Chlorobiota bacterium]